MMTQIGVGFFKGAGIPKGRRVNTFVECGCCGAFHRTDFHGDCREDSERYHDDELPENATVVYLDDEDDSDICEACGYGLHDDGNCPSIDCN